MLMEARHHPKYSPFQCMNSARLSRPTELLAFQKKSRLHRLEADFDEALEKAPQLREASKNLFIFNFRVSFFVTVFAPKSKKGFLMLQMSHNGWYQDNMPFEMTRAVEWYAKFLILFMLWSWWESPVYKAGGRLAKQKAGCRPDAPARDETWIWCHGFSGTVTDCWTVGQQQELLFRSENVLFQISPYKCIEKSTNAMYGRWQERLLQCEYQIRIAFQSIVEPSTTKESYESIEKFHTIFTWRSEIGHSPAYSEISIGPYRKQVWWGT